MLLGIKTINMHWLKFWLVFEVKLQFFSNIHAVTIYGNHVCQNDAWMKNIARKFEIIDRIEIVCLAISAPTTNKLLLDMGSCKWYYAQGTFILALPWSGMSIGFVPPNQWLTLFEIVYFFSWLVAIFNLHVLRCPSPIKPIDNMHTTIHCF